MILSERFEIITCVHITPKDFSETILCCITGNYYHLFHASLSLFLYYTNTYHKRQI
jgi:hypothetical protein